MKYASTGLKFLTSSFVSPKTLGFVWDFLVCPNKRKDIEESFWFWRFWHFWFIFYLLKCIWPLCCFLLLQPSVIVPFCPGMTLTCFTSANWNKGLVSIPIPPLFTWILLFSEIVNEFSSVDSLFVPDLPEITWGSSTSSKSRFYPALSSNLFFLSMSFISGRLS